MVLSGRDTSLLMLDWQAFNGRNENLYLVRSALNYLVRVIRKLKLAQNYKLSSFCQSIMVIICRVQYSILPYKNFFYTELVSVQFYFKIASVIIV